MGRKRDAVLARFRVGTRISFGFANLFLVLN